MSGFTINSVTISGNLTRDPELNTTSGGTSVCRLRLAVNERFKDSSGEWSDRPNYFDVTVWKGLGEWLANNLKKGDQLAVEGRLRWHEWDATDGSGKRQAVDIVASSIVPVRRGEGGGSSNSGGSFTAGSDEIPIDTGDLRTPVASGADDDIPF